MKTKALVALTVLAILAALSAWSTALAQTPRGLFGTVLSTDCGAGAITVDTNQGARSLKVTLQTQVRSAGKSLRCQDITLGARVAVSASEEAGALSANIVAVVPGAASTAHIAGVVAEVKDNTVTIVDRDGKSATIQLTPGMAAPAPGQMVIVVGQREEDKLVAKATKKAEDVVTKVQDDLKKVSAVADQDNLKARLEQSISQHLSVLSQAVDKAPEAAKDALRRAIENSAKGYEQALQSVGKTPEARLEGVLQSASSTSLAVTYSGNRSITFNRTASTRVELSGADTLAAGMWVTVDYNPVTMDALRVAARPPDVQRAAKVEMRGPIEKMDDKAWVIGGATVSVAKDTKKTGLAPKIGLFAKATVVAQPDGSQVAVEIVVSAAGGVTQDRVEFEGAIDSIATTTWRISGRQVQVAKDTKIDGSPRVGGWAQVVARVQQDASLLALSIDTTVSPKQGPTFQGIIQTIEPTGWVVSGVTVRLATDVEIEGTPKVGDRVQFSGAVQADGSFLARSVTVKGAEGEKGQVSFQGTVERTGADTWVVSGVTLTVGPQTRLVGNPNTGDTVSVEAVTLPTGAKVAIVIQMVKKGTGR